MDDLLSHPAAPVPPGHIQNLDKPPNQKYLMILTAAVCLGFATPVVLIRLYVNAFITRILRWDDALVLFNWLAFIAYSVNFLESLQYGSLVDIWNVRLGALMKWAQIAYAQQILYGPLLYATKLSVLVLYRRLFVPARGKKTWIAHGITFFIVFNSLYYLAEVLVFAFRCTPVRKSWTPGVEGKCLFDGYSLVICTASLNTLSNVFMLSIPVSVIWKLRLPRRRKIEISLVFGCGILHFTSSTAELTTAVVNMTSHNSNETMALAKVAMWTFGEITAYFLASCMPMVPRFIRYCKGNTSEFIARSRPVSRSIPIPSARVPSVQIGPDEIPPMGRMPQSLERTHVANIVSWLRSTRDSCVAEDEEDPYFVGEGSHHEADEEKSAMTKSSTSTISTTRGSFINEIVVSRTVEISSVPRAHTATEREKSQAWYSCSSATTRS